MSVRNPGKPGVTALTPLDAGVAGGGSTGGISFGTNLIPKVLSGATYTVSAADKGYLLVFTNGSLVAVTLPTPTGGVGVGAFPQGFYCQIMSIGGGGLMITPPSGISINGKTAGTAIALAQGQSVGVSTDGSTNFYCPTGLANPVATPLTQTDRQIFSTPGSFTWIKPTTFTPSLVRIFVVGGGAGGGSGAQQGATLSCSGGAGGGGGGVVIGEYNASDLGATEAVVVGSGGAGGTAQATASTAGSAGGSASVSSFGTAATFVQAARGSAGAGGGLASGSAGGTAGAVGTYSGTGGASGTNGSAGSNGGQTSAAVNSLGPTGGGSGAGQTGNSTANNNGGAGGINNLGRNISGATGAAGGVASTKTAAAAGSTLQSVFNFQGFGQGGGGGWAASDGTAGAGGAGGFPGGGGGGGGSSVNGNASGAGGAGGGGLVVVISQV